RARIAAKAVRICASGALATRNDIGGAFTDLAPALAGQCLSVGGAAAIGEHEQRWVSVCTSSTDTAAHDGIRQGSRSAHALHRLQHSTTDESHCAHPCGIH